MTTADWIAAAIAPAVEATLGRALAMDPDARRRIERLGDAGLEIHVTGIDLSLVLIPMGDRLALQPGPAAPPAAARIGGPPASLAMLASRAGTRVLFSGDLRVEGDVQVAKAWKRLFDTLDPDWEETLARAIGDIPAHEAGRLARGFRAWAARAISGRREDLRAWLTDETETLPARPELDAWLAEVDRIRADGDRLAARVARLERRNGHGRGES